MTTFSEYPAHTMASNDFTLYPYPEQWNQEQSYLPTSTYADQSYLHATSYDSYQAQQGFAPVQDHYDYSNQTLERSKNSLQAPSSYHSPAHSSFDHHNAPQLSSVSDSGASVQSTISSAMGSPSAQPLSHDWSNQQMDVFPEIVQQHDGGVFATTGFEYGTIPVTDKGCVGELWTFSSSQQLQAILPVGSSFSPSVASPSDSSFRSPTTPASFNSPQIEGLKGRHRVSTAPSPSKRSSFAPVPTFQSPFFSQSSGYFVPPLEASCSSPLAFSYFPIFSFPQSTHS